jgi:polyketide cyclase/dehydrase/lipid transport protein
VTPDIEERIVVAAPLERAYAAVTDVRRMAKWSPECFGVWVTRRRDGQPTRFVGFNRRKGFVWFTTCKVLIADPDREFTFDVFTFGMPVARWGYRFTGVDGGATEITEYWVDRRTRGSYAMGRVFTGAGTKVRPEINRAGMRVTLERLKRELEQG